MVLVVSPEEALRANVRYLGAQCDRKDSLLKKAYESAAYIIRAENTVCQLISAASNSLETVEVYPSVPWFLQTALLAMGHVTRELGSFTATLLNSRQQVWFTQDKLSKDCKKTLRDLPIFLGHFFGPVVSERLEKCMKLSAATQQLTQETQRVSKEAPRFACCECNQCSPVSCRRGLVH